MASGRWRLPRRRFGGGRRGPNRLLTHVLALVLALCILTGGRAQTVLTVPSKTLTLPGDVRSLSASSASLLDGLGDFFSGLLESILGSSQEGSEEESYQENAGTLGPACYVGRPSYLEEIPEYTGESFCWLEGRGDFTREEFEREPYEYYGPLDELGRPTVAEALLDISLMPTQEREAIGMMRPAGWHTVKYDFIKDLYLYNRCHLIGFQLTGENANERNLITGTRYLNIHGMLPWENLLADFIRHSPDQCLYRVTPIYEGDNLIASGLHMEAESVMTDELWFNIYVFNVQPGVVIDYHTGDSWAE